MTDTPRPPASEATVAFARASMTARNEAADAAKTFPLFAPFTDGATILANELAAEQSAHFVLDPASVAQAYQTAARWASEYAVEAAALAARITDEATAACHAVYADLLNTSDDNAQETIQQAETKLLKALQEAARARLHAARARDRVSAYLRVAETGFALDAEMIQNAKANNPVTLFDALAAKAFTLANDAVMLADQAQDAVDNLRNQLAAAQRAMLEAQANASKGEGTSEELATHRRADAARYTYNLINANFDRAASLRQGIESVAGFAKNTSARAHQFATAARDRKFGV